MKSEDELAGVERHEARTTPGSESRSQPGTLRFPSALLIFILPRSFQSYHPPFVPTIRLGGFEYQLTGPVVFRRLAANHF